MGYILKTIISHGLNTSTLDQKFKSPKPPLLWFSVYLNPKGT